MTLLDAVEEAVIVFTTFFDGTWDEQFTNDYGAMVLGREVCVTGFEVMQAPSTFDRLSTSSSPFMGSDWKNADDTTTFLVLGQTDMVLADGQHREGVFYGIRDGGEVVDEDLTFGVKMIRLEAT